MRNFLIFFMLISLLQGCGSTLSDQVEGKVWKDNFSRLGDSQAYTSFINGNVMSCVGNEGTWKAISKYEIKGNKLTIVHGDESKRTWIYEIKIKGHGDKKELLMAATTGEKRREMVFPISTTEECAMRK